MEFSSLAGATTGRSLVLFEEGAAKPGMAAVREAVGPSIAGGDAAGTEVFETLGVAVVDAPPEQVMQAAGSEAIIAIEPERIVYALELAEAPHAANGHAILPAGPPLGATEAVPVPPFMPAAAPAPAGRSADYLRGYRDAVMHLTDDLAGAAAADAGTLAAIAAIDETQATWGLQATKVVNCCRTGTKIRVAVLDTGFDLQHPDFAGRTIKSKSFVPGEAVQDGHGHGTHCIGTALGRKCPPKGRPRYGVAHQGEVYAGKVLSNAGLGLRHRHPRRHRMGDREQVRRRLDVARRADPAGPAVLPGLRARRAARAGQGDADRGRRRERLEPAGDDPPGLAPGELPLDHGRRGARLRTWGSRSSPTAGSTRTAGRSTSRRRA